MTEALYQVGTTQWWILVEDQEIIDKYNKSQVQADIAIIQNQLAVMSDPDEEEQDLTDVIVLVDNSSASQERQDRVKALLNNMWEVYQGTSEIIEVAELRAKLERLQAIFAVMEA